MSKEAMKLAISALEAMIVDVKSTPTAYEAQRQAIAALREALADHSEQHLDMVKEQPAQQEPVAWMHEWEDGERINKLMEKNT